MEVGQEREVVAEEPQLAGLWLLHLHDERLAPRVGRSRHDRGAGGLELGVGDRGPLARSGLDEGGHPMAVQLADAVGRDRHPALGGLDLGRHPHGQHGSILADQVNARGSGRPVNGPPRRTSAWPGASR